MVQLAEYYSLQLLILLLKDLKTKKLVTSKPDRFTKTNAFLNAEILISSQLGMQPETTTKSQMEFGGGDFSGGGSSGSFRYKAQHLLILLKSK
jgi:uncharacterized membrane protein YgcG